MLKKIKKKFHKTLKYIFWNAAVICRKIGKKFQENEKIISNKCLENFEKISK